LGYVDTRRPVTPENIKGAKPMNSNDSKTKEERLLEIYIEEYITKTQYYVMYNIET